MRKLIVAAVVAAFAVYCWQAYQNYARLKVPTYETVEIDLFGGVAPEVWQKDSAYRHDRLLQLSQQQYQPTADGLAIDGRTVPPEQPLTLPMLTAITDSMVASGRVRTLTLRDPAPLLSLAQKQYRLRNPIFTERDGQKVVFEEAGQVIDKPLLDRLLAAGVTDIHVVGAGGAVEPQAGTLLMVVLIFIGLAMALQGILWEPVLKVVDERNREIHEGSRLVRANREEAGRLEAERIRQHAEVRRSYMRRLAATQHEAQREADQILVDARIEAKLMRDKAHAELDAAVQQTRQELMKSVPELAAATAEQVLGRPPKQAKG